ncbi:hypothetical protein BGZ95_004205 [Linnemannia exigua]|uniref:histidine kinase n=1 Tax=Linnemannia exigua TaxID=604196 RepID=A0AAD4D398_9FUNG|nr:hypothetical protein BGZ95_004205 [Linnemannia exigua]
MDPDPVLTANTTIPPSITDLASPDMAPATTTLTTTATSAAMATQSTSTTTTCLEPGDDAEPHFTHSDNTGTANKNVATTTAPSLTLSSTATTTTATPATPMVSTAHTTTDSAASAATKDSATTPQSIPNPSTASPRTSTSSCTSSSSAFFSNSSPSSTITHRSASPGSKPSLASKRPAARTMSLSSSSSSSMSELLRRQSSTSSTSFSTSRANSTYMSSKGSDPMQGPHQISLSSFLLWLRDHPSSSKVGSENLARFLLVKSVSLIAACLGCVYGLVFDRQPSISACSLLLFFLPAVQGFTGATRLCGLVLSLALASVFLNFQTRSMPLVGPSLETTLLVGLPLVTGMLVGRKVGLATCIAVIFYSIEEYRSKTLNANLSEDEASRLWAGFGAYWISLLFIGAITCLYQWCVEVCVRDANLFKDIAVANAKSKDGVVSSVSHELRTPLAALIGWTELLMSDQTLSSSAQSTVSMLHSSTLSLLTILNALLDVSKVSAAKMTNCSQNFNLHDLVLDTARMMTGLSGTRTVELLVDFSAQVPELVRADPGIIKQVLGNLISNAIKFTDVGFVNVGVSLKDEDDDTVTVEFVVQDTGKGIAEEQKDKLFCEFSQVEGGNCKNHEAGTGLGLFLVKNLVEVMNGTVFVDSKLGVGSTFGFEIKMEKQYLAFRTPGYDHVVTVSSAFPVAGQDMNLLSPMIPVTPGLARSTTPLLVNDALGGCHMTPASTPSGAQAEAKDYFALQPAEVTRANANNITLRTRDNNFLSYRQYYLHSQCGFFEEFLWNTSTERWKAQAVRKLSFNECTQGWQTDFNQEDSMVRFGDVFLIDLSPTTNRKTAAVLTDQDHARVFLAKLSQLLMNRAKGRIGTARQASIVLFYPFGHPPSLAQEPLLSLGQYYQISLCRKPVSERALGAIIKKQVVTVQAAVPECVSTPTTPACTSSSRLSSDSSCHHLSSGTESFDSLISSSSSSDEGLTETRQSAGISAKTGAIQKDRSATGKSSTPKTPSPTATQASHVRFAKRNGSVPRLALNGDAVTPQAASGSPSPSIEKALAKKSLLKRPLNSVTQQSRPSLASQQSIQGLNAAGKRVLIVDDNSFNRNLLFHQLTKLGVSKIDQAGSGQEAVDTFLPGTHALVLMDLKMPTMGGFEATALIRNKELAYWGPAAVQRSTRPWPDTSNLESDPWSPERFVAAPEISERRSNKGDNDKKDAACSKADAQSDVGKSATVIAVTADWTAEIGEDREKAVAGGFDDVMVKPISLPSLSVLLERYSDYRK